MNKNIIKINFSKANNENLSNFLFFNKWLSDNITLINFWLENLSNTKIWYLIYKYELLNPIDRIIIENLKYYRSNNELIPKTKLNENLYKKNILYYKLLNRTSMYFWELNQRYNIIQKNYTNLYEICNFDTMSDSIILINDKYFSSKVLYINSLNLAFLSTSNYFNEIFETIKATNKKNYQQVNFQKIIDFNNYEKELNKIDNIDFIYLTFSLNSTMITYTIMLNIARLFELYTFLKIINKINTGGSICLFMNQLRNINHLKLISFYCYFFESYHITYPIMYDYKNFNCFYLILKFKKNISFDPTNMLKELLENSPSLSINHKLFTNENEVKHQTTMTKISPTDYYDSYDEKIIDSINITNPDIEKIYNDVEQEYTNIFNNYSFKYLKKMEKFKDYYDKYEKGTLTEEKIEEINNYIIEECKSWARKYNMPLTPEYNIGHFDLSYQNIMYRDIVSFEKDISFRFKPYDDNEPDIKFTTIEDFKNLPPSFLKMIGKSREDIRAFDYRNIDIYKSIKYKIDYYYKKITYAISFTYDLPRVHVNNDEWLKITEILHKIKVIDSTKTNLKSFHICELSGSFINAISFFIDLNNYNIAWSWKAQTMNPKSNIIYNEKLITNDFDKIDLDNLDINNENLLDIHYDNYDFGSDNTGDITKYENLQYYRNNHNDYDLITVGCGTQHNNSEFKFLFSQYLMIFSCCKKGGSSVLKRVFPIENSQELNMLYLFYCLFENVIVYKPKLNYHSQEYFLIGLNYKGISQKLLDKLIDFVKDYKTVGFITDMPTNFTLQVDKMQNELIENMNKFIKKQIYFCDNYDNIKKDEWDILKQAIKEKLKDWFADIVA